MAVQRVWQNGAWKNLGVQYSDVLKFSENTPDNPNIGDLWYDTNTGESLLKIWNSAQWVVASHPTYSSAAPSVRILGQLWYDSANESLNIWSDSNWIEIGKRSDDANNIIANQVFR